MGQVPVLDSARPDGICFTKGSWKWMSVLTEETAFSEKFISTSNSNLGLLEVSQNPSFKVWFALFNTKSSCILTNLEKALDYLVNIAMYFAFTVSSTWQKHLACPIPSNSPSFLLWLLDPCRNFHCKRGKVCHVDKQGKPSCICQDPAACPSTKDYEHVSISFSAQHGGKPIKMFTS